MNSKNIPLLPAFVERPKDAARSVKQGVYVLITQVSDATLTHLLDLEQFEVTGYGIERDKKQDIVHIYGKIVTVQLGKSPYVAVDNTLMTIYGGLKFVLRQNAENILRHDRHIWVNIGDQPPHLGINTN